MSEFNKSEGANESESYSWDKKESVSENKVEAMANSTGENLAEIKQQIEDLGGEVAFQKKLDHDELFRTRWDDKYKRLRGAVAGFLLTASSAAIGYGLTTGEMLDKIGGPSIEDTQRNKVLVPALGVLSFITGAVSIVEFVKAQQRISKGKKLGVSYKK